MEYVIGIDSGGTNYRVQAEDLNGTILGRYVGSFASHYVLAEETVKAKINHHIDACLAMFGGRREDCRYLVCGTTGLDAEEDHIYLNNLYQSLEGFCCPMVVKSDAELAYYTMMGEQGILVISGTGSIAFGVNRRHEARRVGGWSFSIMGEEGSGTWVTRKALRYLADCYDGVLQESMLADMIKENLNIHTVKEMTDYSAFLTKNPQNRVNLGEIIDRAAESGDANAIGILKAAAKETFILVDKLIRVLEMQDDAEIPVGIWGSNIVESKIHATEFERLLRQAYPQAVVRRPKRAVLDGAGQLARELLKQSAEVSMKR